MARARITSHCQNPKLGVSPEGTLLDFAADLSNDFGFAYERFLNFAKDSHSHERFVFCTARGNCVFEVTELRTGKTFTNSKSSTVFKAPHSRHSLKCDQTIYENLVFLVTTSRIRKAFEELGYSDRLWNTINEGIREIPRSEWFNALVERYFRRKLFSSSDLRSLSFLESEILREVLVLALGDPSKLQNKQPKSIDDEPSDPLKRAIESIEVSLFSKFELNDIAKSAGVSRASLLRAFQRELKMSPIAYARRRKLEEAKRLLLKRKHSVTEVAFLVGYEDSSAFCRAYRDHFGSSPRASI